MLQPMSLHSALQAIDMAGRTPVTVPFYAATTASAAARGPGTSITSTLVNLPAAYYSLMTFAKHSSSGTTSAITAKGYGRGPPVVVLHPTHSDELLVELRDGHKKLRHIA